MTMLHHHFSSFTGCQFAIRCLIEILSQRSNALGFVHLSIFLADLRSEIHDRATRHRNTLEISFYKTATGQRSCLFRSVKLCREQSARTFEMHIDTLHNFKTSPGTFYMTNFTKVVSPPPPPFFFLPFNCLPFFYHFTFIIVLKT